MSLVTKGIGLAKKAKHHFQDQIRERTPVYLSPVRRIEQVAIRERICAMTFDDGPCRLPANPDHFRGKALTLVLAETLERFGARGTFDVVGDTSANYPDKPGKHGSASWGGVAYDHYPDFGQDSQGGVVHCPELIDRLLAGGHEITSHTYSHVLFGWKPLVYGRRKYLQGLDPVVADLKKLHHAMEKGWGYPVRLGRPPHYVDGIKGGFTSYDAYALMGYQYMAASFDGAGWLPLASYEDRNAFKIYLLDVGLLGAASRLDASVLVEGRELFSEFKGALTENYVCQELVASGKVTPYYWSAENSSGEVDFVYDYGRSIVPVEAKAATNLKAKSLRLFVERNHLGRGLRLSLSPFKEQDWVVNLPLYAAGLLPDWFARFAS